MYEYLVQEEDAVSRFTLEDGSGSILLEESFIVFFDAASIGEIMETIVGRSAGQNPGNMIGIHRGRVPGGTRGKIDETTRGGIS